MTDPSPDAEMNPAQTDSAELRINSPKRITLAEILRIRVPAKYVVVPLVFLVILIGGSLAVSPALRDMLLGLSNTRSRDFQWQDVSTSSLKTWAGTKAITENPWPRCIIFSRTKTPQQATDLYQQAIAQLPDTAEALCVGQCLMISLPDSNEEVRREWADRLEAQTTGVEVHSSERPITIPFTFEIADPVKRSAYKSEPKALSSFPQKGRLIPPWVDLDPRTPEQIAAHRKARRTYEKLQADDLTQLENTWEVRDLFNQYQAAHRKRDNQRVIEVSRLIAKKFHDARVEIASNVRSEPDTDPIVCDLWLQQSLEFLARAERFRNRSATAPAPSDQEELGEAEKQLIDRLGCWPIGQPLGRAACEDANFFVPLDILTFHCSPNDPVASIPMIVRWLESMGANRIRLSIRGHYGVI